MKRVIRWLGMVALLMVALTSLARAILYLIYVYFQVQTPLDAFHLEAKMVHLAWRAQQGLAMYPDWHDLPNYESNFFGPLYFLVVGWMGKATGAGLRELYLLGRAVTVASGFVGAGIVGLAARRRYGKGAGAGAALQSLGAGPLAGFGVMSRPDLMADAMGFGGFLLAIGPAGKKRWRLVAGGGLMILAVMTKQTAGVYLLAAGLGLAAAGRTREGASLVAGVGLVMGLVAGVLAVAWEPRFVVDLLGEAGTPSNLTDWRTLIWRLVVLSPEMVLLCAAGMVVWLRGKSREPALAVGNAVVAIAALGASTKYGADLNYFLGCRCFAAMAMGAIWGRSWDAMRRESGAVESGARLLAIVGGVVLLGGSQFWGVRHMVVQAEVARAYDGHNRGAGRATLAELKQLEALVADGRYDVLTDDGYLALFERERAPFVDPWLFRMRVESGRLDPKGMVEKLEHSGYDYVITTHDLGQPTYDTYTFGLPREVARAARERYRFAGVLGGLFVYERVGRGSSDGDRLP